MSRSSAVLSVQTDMLSQEATAGGGAALCDTQCVRTRTRVCVRACAWPFADGVPSPQGGRDKQSVWAEIRWEQTPVRLTDCK